MCGLRSMLWVCAAAVVWPSVGWATFIDFETTPNGAVQTNLAFIGNATYDSLGIHLRSEGYGCPQWRTGVYNGNGWFILGGPKWLGGASYDRDHIGMDLLVACNSLAFDFMSVSGIQYWAYRPDGSQIGTGVVSNNGAWKKVVLATSAPGDLITRVELKATTYNTVLAIDNVEFVPEPASLAMLALGGLLASRRRRAGWRPIPPGPGCSTHERTSY